MSEPKVRSLPVSRYLQALHEADHDVAVSEAHGLSLAQLEALPDDPNKARLVAVVSALQAEGERPNLRLARILRDAVTARGPGLEEIVDPASYSTEAAPRWPSGLSALDEHAGGFYGLSLVSGEPGVGKSLLSLGSALEAARSGWSVIYIDAELDRRTMARRILQYLRRPPLEVSLALARFRQLRAGPGLTIESLAAECAFLVPIESLRALVVIDSVNTVAKLSAERHGFDGYFDALRRVVMWASAARREAEGDLAFLLVSELNGRGETLGREADYAADLVLRMAKGDHSDRVVIDVAKGRESGPAELGMFWRDHARGRFVYGGGR